MISMEIGHAYNEVIDHTFKMGIYIYMYIYDRFITWI